MLSKEDLEGFLERLQRLEERAKELEAKSMLIELQLESELDKRTALEERHRSYMYDRDTRINAVKRFIEEVFECFCAFKYHFIPAAQDSYAPCELDNTEGGIIEGSEVNELFQRLEAAVLGLNEYVNNHLL